jgi:hypothetical protein
MPRQAGDHTGRPMLAWDNRERHDLLGVVVWRMRLAGRYLAEARLVSAHRVRLLLWDDRGQGPLVFARDVFSVNDPPDDPDLGDVAEWAMSLEKAATTRGTSASVSASWLKT